jgi:hypothetical protein
VIGLLIGLAAAGNSGNGASPPVAASPAATQTSPSAPLRTPARDVTKLREQLAVARHQAKTAAITASQERRRLISARSAIGRAQRARAVAVAAEQRANQRANSSGSTGGGSTATPTSCTQTSTGNCIQGGEFCAAAEAGQTGVDANGTEYVCRNGHWENP